MSEPWQVTSVEFDAESKRLDLRVDFSKGATFSCPECDVAGLKAYDTEEKTWRHLDFFQHQAYLTARVPRVDCPEHKVRQVTLPWAQERSGFTLLFEALVMAMVSEMPVKAVAGVVGEYDKRIWRIVHHYVDQAVEAQNREGVQRVGIDETSSRRGHEYVSVFADLDERRGVFVVDGKDHRTVQAFSLFLETHGGDPGVLDELDELLAQPLETVRAYTLSQQFDSFYEIDDPDTAAEYLRRWITEVDASGLEPLQKFARMLQDHWLGVARWHHSKVSNGLLEGSTR